MITLGQASNYSVGQVFRHLFAWGSKNDSVALRQALAVRYNAKIEDVALYHTGRSALAVAITEAAQHRPYHVIVPGLTCIAVVRAVRAAGFEPVFVDIEPDTLAYNLQKLEQKLKSLQSQAVPTSVGATLKNPIDKNGKVCYNGSIILVQNTLGISWNVSKIEGIANKYGALIVEDLAHSAGRKYPDGREVGTVGATAALSFGKGKAIDTISGGAVIVCRHDKNNLNATSSPTPPNSSANLDHLAELPQPTQKPKLSDRLRDRWYPFLGLICRATWRIGFGKALMCLFVKLRWVQRSADAELNTKHRLTHWQAKLALRQLQHLPTNRLRDYRLVQERTKVLTQLHQNGYNLDEIWYDTPVSPRRYADEANFPTQECPETITIANQIINLPTWYKPDKLAKAYKIIKKYEVN